MHRNIRERVRAATLLLCPVLLVSGVSTGALGVEGRGDDKDIDEVLVKVDSALSAGKSGAEWPEGAPAVDELLTHESHRVRRKMCRILASYVRKAPRGDTRRQQYVEKLTDRLSDSSPWVSQPTEKWLMTFSKEAFNAAATENIRRRFVAFKSKPNILLMGIVDPEFCIKTMEDARTPVVDPAKPLNFPGWWTLLVSARTGEADSLQLVLKVMKEKEKDDSLLGQLKLIRLFGDIEYIRQEQIVEYFRRHLFSNKKIETNSNDVADMPYSSLAAQSLARMLRGFPASASNPDRPAPVAECRRWMSGRKEFDFR